MSGNEQQLLLLNLQDKEDVSLVIDQWRRGDLPAEGESATYPKSKISFAGRTAPLTLGLIFLGFVGAALAAFGPDFIRLFTFWDPSRILFLPFIDFDPWIDISNGQFWRLITPVFLHFGPVHIIFNALWIWYLGTVVEFNQGRWALLFLTLIIGGVSNAAQAFVSEGIIFGGLSGVVHGLFAYVWLYGFLNPDSKVQLPTILFVIITVLMLLSPTGIFDIIVGGEIADTVHISGYICGALGALLATLIKSSGMNLGSR